MALFDRTKAVGIFSGLTEGGMEFGAQLVFKYNRDYQNLPMLGQFVTVELERPDEAVLGRIAAIGSHGRLASVAGEDLGLRGVEENRVTSEDIKKQFLRYRCTVRLLGLLREKGDRIVFTPSHRRLPHTNANVYIADGRVLKAVAGGTGDGTPIGFLAFGEFVYAEGHAYQTKLSDRFQALSPIVEPRFDVSAMVSRRSCIFARSGFGKSNLLKMLLARLYEDPKKPPVVDRRGTAVPVGTLVFDPDGDYFWPGAGVTAPPGLCDIPSLKDSIVLITDREHSAPYYRSFKVSRPRLDLRDLKPSLVLSCVLEKERLGQRGTEALMRLDLSTWRQLVDLAWADHNQIRTLEYHQITTLCRLGEKADAIAGGIRNTLLDLVAKLHDPTSIALDAVQKGLSDGKLVIVDLSLMRGRPATTFSAILLRWLFEVNVEEHTKPDSQAIPIIALIEEAQKVLEEKTASNAPFIEWVKEGRKYDLGSVLVTQQPGAIEHEIVSQSDNMFVFHLLSGQDLSALRTANGHFSEDILACLLNEPIEGQGVFWSSAGRSKTTYPIPFRAYDFGDVYRRLDDGAAKAEISNYASAMLAEIPRKEAPDSESLPVVTRAMSTQFPALAQITETMRKEAEALKADPDMNQVNDRSFPLFIVSNWLRNKRGRKRDIDKIALGVVTLLFGLHGYGWRLEDKTSRTGKPYEQVVKINPEDGRKRLEKGEEPMSAGAETVSEDEPTAPEVV